MSVKYSHSPELRLKIGESRLRAVAHAVFCLLVLNALWEILSLGHLWLGVALSLLLPVLLWRRRLDGHAGAELCWRQGVWTLEHGARRRFIVPGPHSVATPLVIYLPFRELPSGPAGRLWLFVDSAPAAQLRRLRVRLALT